MEKNAKDGVMQSFLVCPTDIFSGLLNRYFDCVLLVPSNRWAICCGYAGKDVLKTNVKRQKRKRYAHKNLSSSHSDFRFLYEY